MSAVLSPPIAIIKSKVKLRPISADQARYIEKSALIKAQKCLSPDNLLNAAHAFFAFRDGTKSMKELQSLWARARATAERFRKDLDGLVSDDSPVAQALPDFLSLADTVLVLLAKQPRGSRGHRSESLANRGLTNLLCIEFERIYEIDATPSPQGPFHLFVDAFLEVVGENVTAGSGRLPGGATLLKHLAELRSINIRSRRRSDTPLTGGCHPRTVGRKAV
jgi:hypothetical protein